MRPFPHHQDCYHLVKVKFATSPVPVSLYADAVINQSKTVFLMILEQVSILRTCCAGGLPVLEGALRFRGGSSRQFLTEDLHAFLSWVNSSLKRQSFRSSFTHSAQVFLAWVGPFFPEIGQVLNLFISPEDRMTCPYHLRRRSWN